MKPELAKLAIENCGTTEFERFSQMVVGSLLGPSFKPLGGTKDGGADGFIDCDIFEEQLKPDRFFQASKEINVESKIRKTIARLLEVGRSPAILYFASSQSISNQDKLRLQFFDETRVHVTIFDRNYFSQHSDDNAAIKSACDQYLSPSLAFLDELRAPSFPERLPFRNAQAVCAFLSHELERRLGTTSTLEAVCDALIIWSLEETDPDQGKLMTKAQILEKVESVIPTAKQFLRGQIDTRIEKLGKKKAGARTVNVYKEKGAYCLPYESRRVIQESLIADESLKLEVTEAFRRRLLEGAADRIDAVVLEAIPSLLHRTLETLFENQGYNAVRHFSDNADDQAALDTRAIIEIAGEMVAAAKFPKDTDRPLVVQVMKDALRGVLYTSTPVERAYCGRLSRTYILLFTMKNTPEVMEYFNSMASSFVLYVGSDIIVRALSEYYLHPEDQMTTNALKIIKQSGSKIILSETTLEEVHSHIHATDREFSNVYADIDSIVDRDLASESDRILIRAYYYAKLDPDLAKRPKSWGAYLGNFLSWQKMSSATSAQSMKSLKDTLIGRFGFDFEDKEDMLVGVNREDLKKLAKKIRELRNNQQRGHDEVRAGNDALHILRVLERRRQEEKSVTNPFGYRTWWLTQETKSSIALVIAFPKKRGVRPTMRPEFLVNYIAYNPTTAAVRKSLHNIFPSLMGIRLGTRLQEDTFKSVMEKIKAANTNDAPRALAMIAEHSDALKSQTMRNFAIKYGSGPNRL